MRGAALLALALALVSCAPSEGRLRVLGPEELPEDVYASPSPTPTAAPARDVLVYLVREGRLAPVTRTATGAAELPEFLMRTLLAGPFPEEAAQGFGTALPAGTELLEVSTDGAVVSVNLSKEFELGAEQEILLLRLGQVVYTVTQLARASTVAFLIDGEPVSVIAEDGETHETVGRADYPELGTPPPGAPPEEG